MENVVDFGAPFTMFITGQRGSGKTVAAHEVMYRLAQTHGENTECVAIGGYYYEYGFLRTPSRDLVNLVEVGRMTEVLAEKWNSRPSLRHRPLILLISNAFATSSTSWANDVLLRWCTSGRHMNTYVIIVEQGYLPRTIRTTMDYTVILPTGGPLLRMLQLHWGSTWDPPKRLGDAAIVNRRSAWDPLEDAAIVDRRTGTAHSITVPGQVPVFTLGLDLIATYWVPIVITKILVTRMVRRFLKRNYSPEGAGGMRVCKGLRAAALSMTRYATGPLGPGQRASV
jgi:hypothetical protein